VMAPECAPEPTDRRGDDMHGWSESRFFDQPGFERTVRQGLATDTPTSSFFWELRPCGSRQRAEGDGSGAERNRRCVPIDVSCLVGWLRWRTSLIRKRWRRQWKRLAPADRIIVELCSGTPTRDQFFRRFQTARYGATDHLCPPHWHRTSIDLEFQLGGRQAIQRMKGAEGVAKKSS